MKKHLTISVLTALLTIFLFTQESNAQIKVFSNQNVQIGPYWGGTATTFDFFLNGTGHFNCHPAQYGGFYVESHTYGGVAYPIIRPQNSHNMWLGNSTYKLNVIYTKQLYTLSGGVGSYSDMRLKNNFRPLSNNDALPKIMAIKTYKFDYTEDAFAGTNEELLPGLLEEGKNRVGVKAQELKEVYPEAVKLDEDSGYYTVDYTTIIPLLVEAVKEQQSQIEEQNEQIAALQAVIEE